MTAKSQYTIKGKSRVIRTTNPELAEKMARDGARVTAEMVSVE